MLLRPNSVTELFNKFSLDATSSAGVATSVAVSLAGIVSGAVTPPPASASVVACANAAAPHASHASASTQCRTGGFVGAGLIEGILSPKHCAGAGAANGARCTDIKLESRSKSVSFTVLARRHVSIMARPWLSPLDFHWCFSRSRAASDGSYRYPRDRVLPSRRRLPMGLSCAHRRARVHPTRRAGPLRRRLFTEPS